MLPSFCSCWCLIHPNAGYLGNHHSVHLIRVPALAHKAPPLSLPGDVVTQTLRWRGLLTVSYSRLWDNGVKEDEDE
jgi:hypothetical protein